MAKLDRQELAAYAQTKGYRFVEGGIYGVYGGYPFAAVCAPNISGALVLQLKVTGEVDGGLVKAVRQEAPKGCSVQGVRKAGTLSAICSGKTTAAAVACFEQALEAAVGALRERGLRPPETCPICGQGGCDALALQGGYVPVHRACVENQSQAASARAEENAVMGNYFTGFLGALLGGLVGVIPNVLAAVLLERIFALLYALIPLAAYYGYKLCKGKMNKGAFVCTLISSVINLFVVELANQYIWVWMEYGAMDIAEYLVAFTMVLLEGELTANLLQGAIFLALGLWISWGAITRTSTHEVRDAAAVQATLQPWPVRESAPAWPGAAELTHAPETPQIPRTPDGIQQ